MTIGGAVRNSFAGVTNIITAFTIPGAIEIIFCWGFTDSVAITDGRCRTVETIIIGFCSPLVDITTKSVAAVAKILASASRWNRDPCGIGNLDRVAHGINNRIFPASHMGIDGADNVGAHKNEGGHHQDDDDRVFDEGLGVFSEAHDFKVHFKFTIKKCYAQ